MDEQERAALDSELRALCERGDFEAAAAAALRGYGREIYGFLAGTHRSDDDAAEVFSDFSEHLWKSLGRFRWESSFRTWAYTLARRCSIRFRTSPHRHPIRNLSLSGTPGVSQLEAQARSLTASYRRTEVKDKFASLRESLPPEDQELLVLRVDKQLAWSEIADVFLEDGASAADKARESARLRKRYELVKKKLFELGKEAGLWKDKGAPSGD